MRSEEEHFQRIDGPLCSSLRSSVESTNLSEEHALLRNSSSRESLLRKSKGELLRSSFADVSDMVVKASSKSKRVRRLSSSLCHLQLNDLQLHGREDDMKLLMNKLLELKNKRDDRRGSMIYRKRSEMFSSVSSLNSIDSVGNSYNMDSSLSDLLLISGPSGVGKSALVMNGLRDQAQRMGLVFSGGKFDLNKTALPLSAFVDAMVSLTQTVLEGDERKKKRIRNDIKEDFGEDNIALLVKALPGCEELFPLKMQRSQSFITSSERSNSSIARLQYAIRRLLKIICSHLEGVVIFVDDMQWACKSTLDLLKSISLDSDIPYLFIVGAYRDDQIQDTHLALYIQELEEQLGMDLTTIRIGNLSLDYTTSLTAEALGMEDNEDIVQPLATIVHKKTYGNAFFVLMFLRSIYDEGLLTYNFGIMSWQWDEDAINAKLATDNVTNFLVTKLCRLHWMTQNVLKVASCLGARFSISAVATITENLSPVDMKRRTSLDEIIKSEADGDGNDDSSTVTDLNMFMHELEEQGLWERETDKIWCFTHDKIQSAAFELIHPSKRDVFRGKIGSILIEKLTSEELESSLFAVVSLRNFASVSDKEERVSLAKLNLRAGDKAAENAAFDSAIVYFKAGYELLRGTSGWDIDASLMLELCNGGVEACFICGDLDTMSTLISEVMKQKDIALISKFRVYKIMVQAYHITGNYTEAINTGLEFRRKLGFGTLKNRPTNTLIILKEFAKTNRVLGKMKAVDIASLPELTDGRIAVGQRMLGLLITSVYSAQPTMFPLIIFRMVRASIKYGLDASSCEAFAAFGLILCTLGRLKEGRKMSRVVELLLNKGSYSQIRSRSISICEGFIHHWHAPLQATLGRLLEGYTEGLHYGDLESAGLNLLIRNEHLYYIGRPLENLQRESESSIKAMRMINQNHQQMNTQTHLLIIKTLRGDSSENVMTLNDIMKVSAKIGNQALRAYTYMAMLELEVIFQDWEKATGVLIKAGDLRSSLLGFFAMTRFTFLEGLISVHAANNITISWLKRKQWKRRAAKSIKLIEGWVKKGDVNIVHYLHLLMGEMAQLEGKHKKAESYYKQAINVASRNGFIHDKALSHELASVYFENMGDKYWSNYHMACCQQCYWEWGATTKLEQLRNRVEQRSKLIFKIS